MPNKVNITKIDINGEPFDIEINIPTEKELDDKINELNLLKFQHDWFKLINEQNKKQ